MRSQEKEEVGDGMLVILPLAEYEKVSPLLKGPRAMQRDFIRDFIRDYKGFCREWKC